MLSPLNPLALSRRGRVLYHFVDPFFSKKKFIRASVDSAHMQREAADLLNTPAAMQMRMLDAYKVLAESQNAKIIFMPGIGGGNLGIDGKTSHLEQMNNLTANIVGNNVSK